MIGSMSVAYVIASAKLAGGLTALGVIALVLAVAALFYLSRDTQLSGSAKTMWIVLVLFFPILGPAVYFAVRSDW
jgi:Phospholipase_D-nuclease N-terminal